MNNKTQRKSKVRVYASIIGLAFVANLLLSAAMIFLNYPTEAHRSVARQMESFSTRMMSGEDFAKIMESKEYIAITSSAEANYMNIASFVLLAVNFIVTVAIVGAIYYYLRKNRITSKPVLMTTVLATTAGLLPLILAAYGTAWYVGIQLPGVGHVLFMLFIGLIIGPLVNALIARIFEWHYNRKHSFVIE